MTTYSICNTRTCVQLGRFDADNAFQAIAMAGGGEDLVATAVGLPEAPALADPATSELCFGPNDPPWVYVPPPPLEWEEEATSERKPDAEPEAPAACPFKLPLTVGTPSGSVPDQIFDANGQAVLILYGVDQRGPLETAREMKWNQEGLHRGDYVVKAVNEHEGLVQRVAQQHKDLALMAEHNREFVQENRKLVKRVVELEDMLGRAIDNAFANKLAGIMDKTMCETLVAKAVDRRKD